MKFLNLSNGYSFDALWTEDSVRGYIFWFPNEQSTGLIYSMPIAVVSDNNEKLTISIEDNDIFSLVTHSEAETTVDGYMFNEPIMHNSLTLEPEKVGDKYIYVFNVSCCGKSAGEFISKIHIGNAGYIRVGADLYDEYEPVYVNLSNFGVEIPDTVQKAIYDSNVHEDMTDNILINRKFKELLSNYWDIIANKGSYKSLKNALEWFEWGDKLNIREIWKHYEVEKTIYDDREMCSIFEDKLEDSFTNFVKTTYISLYCAMQNELDTYDSEFNPELENAVFKWSRNDIQLKLSLLAQFFGIYFMPIHMSILHATVEDKVFTNTIKAISAGEIKHQDCFGDFTYVECNIKDGDTFKLGNTRAQVTNRTTFGVKYPDERHLGVDKFPEGAYVFADSLKTFSAQYYTGPGSIIPFELIITNQYDGDFVQKTFIDFLGERYEFNRIFRVKKGKIRIAFNLLVKAAGSYNIRFTFITASGKTITRSVDFNVEDIENLNINIYKVKSKDDTEGFTYDDFTDMSTSKYIFRTQDKKNSKCYCHLRLPYMTPDNENYSNYNGIKLNRTIVIRLKKDGTTNIKSIINTIRYLMANKFLEYARYDGDEIKYLIYVSKKFYEETPARIYNNIGMYDIIRNDLGFYPQFHYLEQMNGNTIDNYTVSPFEALCCAAEINHGSYTEEFRYGHMIAESEWIFTNAVTGKDIEYPASSLQPFIANENLIETGYYDVQFKYSLTNGVTNTCRLNSAFRIKNV